MYEEMVPFQNHFLDSVKRIMLQNTVSGILLLKAVKIQSDHDKANGKGLLTYKNYLVLLLLVAAIHNEDSGF